jgi:hypothetical protein
MTNLKTAYQLFLDSKRIQIRTEFYVGPNFITVTGPTNLYAFSPCSLSLSENYSRRFSLSLFLSAITEEGSLSKQKIPIARTYFIHSSSKKTSSKTHSKKNLKSKPIKLNQQEHDKTPPPQKKKKKKETH